MRRVPLFFVAGAAVVAVALAGYIGASGVDSGDSVSEGRVSVSEDDISGGEAAESDAAEAAESDAAEGVDVSGGIDVSGVEEEELDWEDSPLRKYFSEINGSPEQRAALELKGEEFVAVCMRERGFEYTPYVDPSAFEEPDFDFSIYGTEEWVAQYGYGAFTEPLSEDFPEETPVGVPVDPNQEYRGGLPEWEVTAYDEALYGAVDYSEGCFASLMEPDPFGIAPFGGEEGKALAEELRYVEGMFIEHPVFVEIEEDWASCMADVGYTEFTITNEASDKFFNKRQEFDFEFDVNSAEGGEWRQLEIETALADLNCKTKVDYSQRPLRVQFELEEQFIEDHWAQFAAVLEAVKQGMR